MFPVYAQDESSPYNLAEKFFGDNPAKKYADKPIGTFISDVLPNVYTAIGLILFVYLLFGGFLIVTSSGNEHNMENGQKVITNAIIGLLVVFASYWIIQLIGIVTGIPIL